MRRLTVGVAAVAAVLATPAVAQATHVAGATYTGPVSTGSGGSVELVVAPDGGSLSFEAMNIGNGSSCTGVGFGPVPDIPITNHAFSYTSSNGQISASGSFGQPGDAAGSTQVLISPCTTGSQAWSATTDAPGVDSLIARSTDPAAIGNDVFNTTAEQQTRAWSAERGQRRVFRMEFQNDGNDTGQIGVDGCRSSKGFAVKYFLGAVSVTDQVSNGTFVSGDLAPSGGSFEMLMKIKVSRKAKVGKTKECKVLGSSSNEDAVKAKLKVRRG